jgi:hypothetical protein
MSLIDGGILLVAPATPILDDLVTVPHPRKFDR